MKRLGIRSHVAWLTLIPSIIVVLCLETFSLYSRFTDLDHDLVERGKLIAHQLASSSEYGVFSNNQAFLQGIANGVLQQPDVRGLIVLNASSEILIKAGEFSGHINNGSSYSSFIQFKADDEKSVNLQAPVRGNKQSLWIYQPIISAQVALDDLGEKSAVRQLGAVVVEIDKLRAEGIKTQILWFTVLGTVLVLGIASILVHLASRSITQPIRRLSDAVRLIGGGDLGTRVSLRTNIDEVDTLAQGLNRMASDLQQERAILEQRIDDATQALRAKKEGAERASHDKSRFLAVASHDLRQPLHALGLYVAELRHRVSDDGLQRLVGQVEQSVETLSTLLNALLDISKLDANVVVPQMQACNLNALLEHVAADYQMLARIKNIRLVIRPCSGYITSDLQLLERILTNLISNAIRYTPPNGCVMVACRRRGDFWRIEVRDNGIGITKIDQINIFREFFRLSHPQVNTDNGLGLGLSIVDRLVKLLGHTLKLRSEPGKGSVFAVEAPVAANIGGFPKLETMQSPLENKPEIKISPLAGTKVLVVDDDATVLAGTSSLLASWGCKVSVAASLAEAQQLLRDGKAWDFIISDYQLGENNANGIEVIATVRQHQNEQIPCILISGDTSRAVLKLASVSGHHLLHKPVKPAKLKSLILHLLNDSSGD